MAKVKVHLDSEKVTYKCSHKEHILNLKEMIDISNSIIYLISIIGELKSVCQEYYDRICQVESSKYDLEKEVEYKDYMVRK